VLGSRDIFDFFSAVSVNDIVLFVGFGKELEGLFIREKYVAPILVFVFVCEPKSLGRLTDCEQWLDLWTKWF